MPVNPRLMRALKTRYGEEKGESVYYAMETEGHPSTQPKAVRRAKARTRKPKTKGY